MRWSLLVLLAGCADLTTYDANTCGNNVVEANEDCDLVVDTSLGEDLSCGPPDGTPRACRYLCVDTDQCPDGWACFDDGICRFPSGSFAADDDPAFVVRAVDIALAQITPDEGIELVTRLDGDLGILGLEDGEASEEPFTVSFPTALGTFDVAPFGDDDQSMIFLPAVTDDGQRILHVLEGSADRVVTASAPRAPVGARGAPVTAVPWPADDGLDDLLLTFEVDDDVVLQIGGCPAPFLTLADRSQPTAPRIVDVEGARLVVFGFLGEDRAIVVRTSSVACAEGAVLSEVALPGALVEPGVDLLDLAGDKQPELVAFLEDQRVAVATGDSTGFAAATISTALADLDAPLETQRTECGGERLVLAAGLIDDDARIDFVTEDAIFLADRSGAGYVRVFSRTRQDAWAEAVIGDFDRDGRTDVVASTRSRGADCSTADVEFVRQRRDASFSAAPVSVVAQPRDLRLGDFDADGIDDVAMLERSRDDEHTVAILYGDTKEALEDKGSVARFDDVAIVTALTGRTKLDLNDDRATDLAVFLPDGTVSTLLGSPRRVVLAPIPLGASGGDRDPVAVTAGRLLDRESDLPDVFVLGRDKTWLVPNETLRAPAAIEGRPLTAPLDTLRSECTQLVALDAFDSPDGIVGIDGRYFENERRLAERGPCDHLGAASTFVFTTVDGDSGYSMIVDGDLRVPTEVEVADFDDDGLADVAVRFAYRGEEVFGSVLVWFDVAGGPSAPVALVEDRDVLGIAPIDADADETKELAMFTADGLIIADLEDRNIELRALDDLPFPDFDLDDGPTRLVTGDLDDDGLEDLVLLYGQAVFVYTAETTR